MLVTWLMVGGLMLLCGLAMARLMWLSDGRPPLRKPRETDDDPPEANEGS